MQGSFHKGRLEGGTKFWELRRFIHPSVGRREDFERHLQPEQFQKGVA